ncbi:ThuA domain-containing protein [Protaetiibacter larvae]|uniref:ThuA domain-containing protein n=1 Tax=Protaetiibacter larvae TaxID=2592654 RepID=UPI00143E0975|nr:ThuA domain-containing protein [Protaetiibacter larvae]
MTRAVLFAGGGDYRDPWHPFAESAERLAEALASEDLPLTTVDTVDALAARLPDAGLLVLQAGSGDEANPRDDELLALVRAHLERGRPLLALHASGGMLPEHAAWQTLLGGRWVRDVSWHPEHGEAEVLVADHPITAGLGDFTVLDERYTDLALQPGIAVLAEHEEAGARHPLAWAHRVDAARVVYDALGHDARSYDSAERVALLRRELAWLLDET